MPVIGVAVPIPEPHGRELQAARERFGDPMAAKIPPHVTLLPPTELTPAEEGDLVDHLVLTARASRPFRMSLRGTGTFRPVSPVVFVQVARDIPECEMLERAVRNLVRLARVPGPDGARPADEPDVRIRITQQ